MVGKSTIIGYHPVGAPTCLRKLEVGKPSQNAAQLCAKAHGCVHDDLRADELRKGWGFRVGTWNVDSLTGIDREFVTSAKKSRILTNFPKLKKFVKIPTKIR